jgi:hypothetical protein
MPGVYRLKRCPVCDIEHRKRGPYCSKSHAQSDRKVSEETKQKISDTHIQRFSDRESDAYLDTVDNVLKAAAKAKGIDTTPVPPQIPNRFIDDHREVIDGDYWIEDGY